MINILIPMINQIKKLILIIWLLQINITEYKKRTAGRCLFLINLWIIQIMEIKVIKMKELLIE